MTKAEVHSGVKVHQGGEKNLCENSTRVHQRVGDEMRGCMDKGFICDNEGRKIQ
jgi:hypothetical protein